MRPLLRLGGLAAATCALAGAIAGHVRLFNPTGGQSLFWQSPGSITVTIDPVGSDDIADQSEGTAMRLAMRAWNEDPGSSARLNEGSAAIADACQDWLDTGSHIVFFDEGNCSGFFGGGGAVAVTPVLFNSKGRIVDADVIFNGQFDFSTDGTPGSFDVQDVGTHELGHLLGLDHSGWAGSTMYPYVDEGLVLQRSLSADDVHGLRHIAPAGSHARIDGRVRRLVDGTSVAGAHVYAVAANGRTAGGALADGDGDYSLRGLDAGDYTVYANPLEGPVTELNLQPGHTVETDFEAGGGLPVTVAAGQTVSGADLDVDPDVALRLGSPFDALPIQAESGSVVAASLDGSGLTAGSTLTASDPSVSISGAVWGGSSVSFNVGVPSLAAPGHADLIVVGPLGGRAVLVSAIEIVPPAPTVTGVTPSKVSDIGGDPLTITGTGFRSGASVVIGDALYFDGEGGCSVVSQGTITLTSAPAPTGTYDVVVIDATGLEGRDPAALAVVSMPKLDARFPAVGDAAGGTELILTGQNFQPGLLVRIDSVLQTNVTLEGTTVARVITEGGTAGPTSIEVENPSGEVASLSFSYVAQPDPVLQLVSPASGQPAGGKTVTLTGAGFTPGASVFFGADPLTGTGGTPAAAVTYLDANTLEVVTPALPKGSASVMVQEASGQASLLPGAFQVKSSGGGGGGGCHVVPLDGGPRPDPRLGLAWTLLLLALAGAYAQRARRRVEAFERARG